MQDNKLLLDIRDRAAKIRKTVVLPESHDERVLRAAEKLVKENIASVITIGNEETIRSTASALNLDLHGVRIIDPLRSDKTGDFANIYFNLRKHKGISIEEARATVKKDLFFGAMLVKESMADGFVAGSTASTADVLRAAIQCVGMPDGISIVSSFFLMIFPEIAYSFADCAVVPNPDEEQLADIAITTADNHKKLVNEEPFVAMLSFSTKGSAKHELVDKVINATNIVKRKRPDIKIDGELQFDAAIIDSIGRKKAPNSEVAGKANVLVFPDLQAGNIGYKIAQRLGRCGSRRSRSSRT